MLIDMPAFHFTARDQSGRTQRGVQSSNSAVGLAAELRTRGWLVLDIQVAAETGVGLLETVNPRGWLPVRSVDVEMTLQMLAVMLRSGLTLLNALHTAAQHSERLKLQRILRRVVVRIEEGSSFADALAEHKVFSNLTIQLVRVGEQTGNLDVVIVRASEAMERRRNLVQQVLTALTYPFITLVAAIGVSLFMVLNVIPKLETFIKALGRKLPPTTVFLMDLSIWFRVNGTALVVTLVLAVLGIILATHLPSLRGTLDRYALAVPLIGKVMRVAGTALFARALAILLRSGVTVLDALRTMESLGTNKHLSGIVARTRLRIFAGGSLSEALSEPGGFMPMLGQMVAVGESSGRLDDVLEEVARFFENQLAVLIRQLAAIVEPAIIIFVGGVVGFVYITFFLTIYAAAGSSK
jgi:type IV pilus assembly protein PilC